MAALYQGVADIGYAQSSVKQEYGSPVSNNWGAIRQGAMVTTVCIQLFNVLTKIHHSITNRLEPLV